ncbi:MAG TPA: hypothetical protein VF533_12435 [Solirubrobacteraceae bacterium]|jgi:hypothetical protein
MSSAFVPPVRRHLGAAMLDPAIRRAQGAWALVVAGSWAHATALAVFAYGAGGSAAVGLALAIRSAPAVLGAPLTGLAARLPLGVALRGSAGLTGLALAASAAGVLAGAAWAVYALGAVVALTTMLFRQAHTALLPVLAPGAARLTAANAGATTIESVGMVAGPAVAGVLLAVSSVAAVLAVAAATTLAGAVTARAQGAGRADGPRESALAGFREAAADPAARLILALLLLQTVVSGALNVLFVVCAVELLDLGREGTGLLVVAFGAGGLLGGLATLVRAPGADLVTWLRAGLVLWGLPLVCLGLVPEPALALGLIAAVGLGNALFDVASVTLVQRALSGPALARVLGVLETVVVTGLAIGAGAASLAVAQLGVRGALVVTGAVLPLVLIVAHRPVAGLRPAAANGF